MHIPSTALSLWSVLFFASCLLRLSIASDIDFGSLSGLVPGNTAGGTLPGLLHARQTRCTAGLSKCPSDNYCCPPGASCCGMPPRTCCTVASYCEIPVFPCCSQSANTCGGTTCCIATTTCCPSSPVGCCPGGFTCCGSTTNPCCGPGTTCCGSTCCQSGEHCERGECIDEALKDKVARFEYDETVNGNLLRNMCNGLRGKNTRKFTYSGPPRKDRELLRAKAKKRRNAGCTGNFCKKAINNNGNSSLNSCDEWPPASSDEGGGTTSEQVVACVKDTEQDHQGGVMSGVLKKISKGDSFIISVDCAKVLGSIKPRELISDSGNQAPFLDAKLTGEDGILAGYYMIPFGDLWAGSYSANIQCTAGSTFGGFLHDNTGDNITENELPALTSGQSQQFDFTLEYPIGGAGLMLATHNKSSSFTWSLNGRTFENVTDASLDDSSGDPTSFVTPSSTSTGSDNNAEGVSPPVILCAAAPLVVIALRLVLIDC